MEARRPYDIDSVTDVAFHIFAERGYDATSMEDVARAAGITKASIYHHVPSKEALLDAAVRSYLDRASAGAQEGTVNASTSPFLTCSVVSSGN